MNIYVQYFIYTLEREIRERDERRAHGSRVYYTHRARRDPGSD